MRLFKLISMTFLVSLLIACGGGATDDDNKEDDPTGSDDGGGEDDSGGEDQGDGDGTGDADGADDGGADTDDDLPEVVPFRDAAYYTEAEKGIGSEIHGLAFDADGRLVVSGAYYTSFSETTSLIRRFNTDYTLDKTFGTDGAFEPALGTEDSNMINDLTIMGDNFFATVGERIESDKAEFVSLDLVNATATLAAPDVTGTSVDLSEPVEAVHDVSDGFLVAIEKNLFKLQIDLTLDTAFGTGGEVTAGFDDFRQIEVDDAGTIYVLADEIIYAFNADGTPKADFGAAGEFDAGFVLGTMIFHPTEDALYVLSDKADESTREFRLLKIGKDGELDATFGTAGEASLIHSDKLGFTYADRRNELHILSDGKILYAGMDGDTKWCAIRFGVDGTKDTTYGEDGEFVFFPEDKLQILGDTIVDDDDRLFLGGQITNESSVFKGRILRVTAAGEIDVLATE